MALNRRNFLKTSFSGVAATTLGGTALAACSSGTTAAENGKESKACCANSKAELKLSFQEGTAPGKDLSEKFDYFEKLGIVGFEPGGKGLAGRVNDIKEALKGRNIKVSAICAGFEGFMLSEEESVRNLCRDTMQEIITAAGELGSTGVIIVPAFNLQKPVMPHTQ